MKICKIIIKDFHQFKDFELDLTHPETGEPLDKVCLIGSNGTGKTKLLRFLEDLLKDRNVRENNFFCKFKDLDNQSFWAISTEHRKTWFFDERVEKIPFWDKELLIDILLPVKVLENPFWNFQVASRTLSDLIISVSAEISTNGENLIDVPLTNVDNALKLFEQFPNKHEIADNTINEFWTTLIYHIKKRDNDFQIFQNLEENQNRTVKEVREEFDRQQPKILDSLAKLWDEILGKSGLEFDVASASNPIQLTDNLKAYIKLKSTGERINYNDLSTGIRNFIFKVGHIYSLYFNRNIESGFLLIDEPENSLFPDFLYDLVDIYKSITSNTQIFMATHSPIIAAQFEPYERFILEFDDHGHVQARRGTVPVGDDPNDILSKDFGVRSLLGKEGVKKWERYIELRTIIRMTQDMEEKSRLLDEFMKIGNEYNFSNALS